MAVAELADFEILISTWLRYQHRNDPPDDDPDFWSFEKLDDLIWKEPEEAWLVILEILRRDTSTPIMEILSAGPLEDLLVRHGDDFIERVEAEALSNKDFASLLGGVWQNAMSDELYVRVKRVWDRTGWDGN